jgi:antitoxin component HigA of HigAB toxin-antitoxin module
MELGLTSFAEVTPDPRTGQAQGPRERMRDLLEENGLNATDLARVLGVHPSMGSKILNRERLLTVTGRLNRGPQTQRR